LDGREFLHADRDAAERQRYIGRGGRCTSGVSVLEAHGVEVAGVHGSERRFQFLARRSFAGPERLDQADGITRPRLSTHAAGL
jgi:hypothetical protein